MSEPFVGQIDFFSFSYVPENYLLCDGSVQRINQYQALASLVGRWYGGDGITTFGLPDLRGRVPVGLGKAPVSGAMLNWSLGSTGGNEAATLNIDQYPLHTHTLSVVGATPNTGLAGGGFTPFTPPMLGAQPPSAVSGTDAVENTAMLGVYAGGGGAHENRQPYLVLLPCICCYGTYPDFES